MLNVPITLTVIDPREAAEVVRRFLAEGALGERDAGAVHQHVQAAEFLHRQRHGRLAIGLRRNVGAHEAPADFLGELFAQLGLQVRDHDLGAVFRGHARACRAETRRAAGDEEYAISDLHAKAPVDFADNSNCMDLGFGIRFGDLYEREGLLRVDAAFLAFLGEIDAALRERLISSRQTIPPGEGRVRPSRRPGTACR